MLGGDPGRVQFSCLFGAQRWAFAKLSPDVETLAGAGPAEFLGEIRDEFSRLFGAERWVFAKLSPDVETLAGAGPAEFRRSESQESLRTLLGRPFRPTWKLRTLATDSWGVDTSEVEKVAKGLNNAVIAKVLTEKELTLEHEIWRQMQEEVACGWLALVDDNSVEN